MTSSLLHQRRRRRFRSYRRIRRRITTTTLERTNNHRLERLYLTSTERTARLRVQLLPILQTRRAYQVTARLEFAILVVLGANLADLKRRADVTVHLVLFARALNSRRRQDGNRRRDVDLDVAAVRVDVEALLLAVDECLYERLRNCLQDLVVVCHVADRPLAQFGAAQTK